MAIIPTLESGSEYGTVRVLFWGKEGIGIRSIHPLTVNRVETIVDAHLIEYADGYAIRRNLDGTENSTAFYVRRHDNFQIVSRSARNKVRDMVLQLAKTLLQAKPDLFRKGEEVRLKNALETNLANQATLQRELDELQAERHAIQLAFEQLETLTDQQNCDRCDEDTPLIEYEAGNGLCLNCVSETYE